MKRIRHTAKTAAAALLALLVVLASGCRGGAPASSLPPQDGPPLSSVSSETPESAAPAASDPVSGEPSSAAEVPAPASSAAPTVSAAPAPSSSVGSASAPAQKPDPVPSSEPARSLSIHLVVECKTAVDQGNQTALAVADGGGVVLDAVVTLPPGATAYDALAAGGLVVDAPKGAFGRYVKSIQSLSEKACGPQSGWLYFVNGVSLSLACDAAALGDGDTVSWRYTCQMGKDL